MSVLSLFPTALGVFDLSRDITETELNYIKSQELRDNIGNKTSKNTSILNDPELSDIKTFIETSILDYFNSVYSPKNNASLRITQSWCNYTEPGEFHHKHAHPNSFISGVFYPQANKETDKIYFFKDKYQQLKTPAKEWNPYNSESWWMEAQRGRLFIFPSSLSHVVETVQGKDTRISLSFNTFPVGIWGDDEELTGVHL